MAHGVYVYLPQRVKELTLSLTQFWDCTESLFFETWGASEGLHRQQIHRLVEANENFAEAWRHCEMIQASRLLELSSRTKKTTRGSNYYEINPRIAALVLQNKHGYAHKEEIEVEPKALNRYERVEAAKTALRESLPEHRPEKWLQTLLKNTTDEVTRAAAQSLLNERQLLDELANTPHAIVSE